MLLYAVGWFAPRSSMRVLMTQIGFVQTPVSKPENERQMSTFLVSTLYRGLHTCNTTRREKLSAGQILPPRLPPPQHRLQLPIKHEIQAPSERVPEHVRPQAPVQGPDAALILHHASEYAQ